MNLEDLQYIFRPQLDQIQDQDVKLFFVLQDGDYKMIERHPAQDLGGLIPMLSAFQYAGSEGNFPRFVK